MPAYPLAFLLNSFGSSNHKKSRFAKHKSRKFETSYEVLEERKLMAGVVAIDLGRLSGEPANLATFQAADPNLDANTTFVRNNNSVRWSGGALDTTYDGLTFSTQAGDQGAFDFQASNGNATTDVPLIDSYTFGNSGQDERDNLTLDISGFADLPIGQTITLTAWGVGDNVGQQTAFSSTFGFTSLTQETFFGTNNAGSGAVPFVQFTFTTNGTTDVLNLSPGRSTVAGSTDFIPINGISLSVSESQIPLLPGAHPLVNEFSASNSNIIDDDNGNSSDWIEIYNAGDTAVNLAGYTLTDDAFETDKYVLPDITLLGGQYLVVFAGDDADPTSGTDLYTGFGLSSSGEYLGFFDPEGNLVSEFGADGADYPAQFTDVSYGLLADGSFDTASFFATPTPGSANINPVDGVTSRVNANVAPGFYTTTQLVELSTDTVGASIFYTTDGSTPTNTNGTLYTGAIPISSTTNLRAVSVKQDYLSDFDRTWSYLFVDDIVTQDENQPTPEYPTEKSGLPFDYGFDQRVLDEEGVQAVRDALLAIPSFSITTDLENLFDDGIGIYENPRQSGREWERPASVELLNPDGSEGFQVNAGIRIRGGFSRRESNPKHSFRLFFRSEYGDSELNFPVHGDEGVDTFEHLDLRTAQNYSWSGEGDASNTFLQEVISRQNQGETGELYTRSTWVHLYLNGQYWGLYQTQERAEADFAASYLGGDAEDYDVVRVDSGIGASRTVEATDGNLAAYTRLYEQAIALADDNSTPAFVDNAAYYRAQGLNPDGTRNEDFEVLLDVDNLIHYVTEIFYSGNFDAPITNFGGNDSLNNFFAIRDRTGDEGFKFIIHDAEHSLRNDGRSDNRTGPFNHPEFDLARSFNPQTLHQKLLANQEYRLRFADTIQEKFFGDGIYTTENLLARWDAEATKIEVAIIAESARWGDAQTSTPFLKADWELAVADTRNNFIAERVPIFIEQLRDAIIELRDENGDYTIVEDAPLFPSIDAPDLQINGLNQSGGEIAAGDVLTLSADQTIYFTTDGSDPRDVGGGINANALPFNATEVSSTIFARNSSVWRFQDNGVDLGTAWIDPAFDDTDWESGTGQLGFGDGDEATLINDTNDRITTYFRKTFDVAEGDFTSVTLNLLRDDGAVVYLNGVEVARSNLPVAGPILFDTTASSAVGGSQEDVYHEIAIPTNLLRAGSNTFAIEVHQVSTSSSDVSFDAELVVTTPADGAENIVLDASTNIRARTFSNGQWSALQNAVFAIPGSQSDLRISELHFNPAAPSASEIAAGFDDNDDFEFIELFNPNIASTINLNGVQLADGVLFDFGDFDLLPGERAVVVEDVDAFMARYGNSANIIGQWSGGLSNSGEEVTLLDSEANEILSINYNDTDPWHSAADGEGFSLVLEDPSNTPVDELGKYYSWRSSTVLGGTPGAAAVDRVGVVVNEVLAHSDGSQLDSIELFNTTDTAVDVGGWYLSDEGGDLLKYQIPAGTVIAAGGYLVFDESDFNVTTTGFALSSSQGDQVFLSQAVDGTLVGLQDAVEFGATFSGESLGRLPDGTGRLTRLSSTSFGSANGEAEVGPLVISEVNYHPDSPNAAALAIDSTLTDNDLEYIEVANPTSAAIDLTNWRIRGEADYDFVAGTTLAAGEAILVVSFDPVDPLNAAKLAAFEAHYGITADITIVGGLSASLSNSTGRISLQQPDAPDALGVIPRVVVDEVVYDDLAPWADADGSGQSLERDDVDANGNFSTSWIAAAPTPGVFESSFLLGDVNQDGIVNFLDISPFITQLSVGTFLAEADIDGNGVVNFLDISPFIILLSS